MENRNFFDRPYEIEQYWEEIGIQLEVDDTTLQDIRIYNRGSDMRSPTDNAAFRDMFRAWLKQENPPPTWLNFVNALERFKLQEYADYLRSKYCKCVRFICNSVYRTTWR